jgi:hypothetical protein
MNKDYLDHDMNRDAESDSMAESVTRHAQISVINNINDIKYLTCGIDTMDTSFYVIWGKSWNDLKNKFDERKVKSQGTEGILIEGPPVRNHLFYPSGKAPNYRYHIQFPEYHCFIAISQTPKHSPNVYVSFTSESLNQDRTEKELIELVKKDIESLGGEAFSHKISRCDLYADFMIPGGLSLEFIRSHMVGRNDKTNQYMDGNRLETFYIGGKKSDIQLRIYDKGRELKNKESEERWLALWFIDDPQDVWRVEAQLRWSILKQYKITSVDDLLVKKADLWRYATEEWFSLRYPDNENATRRTVHEFWQKIQECKEIFGSDTGAVRRYKKDRKGNVNWYVQRITKFCIACAAILRINDLESSVQQVSRRVFNLLKKKGDFSERVASKAIELGISEER